jgi:hypothetical protein
MQKNAHPATVPLPSPYALEKFIQVLVWTLSHLDLPAISQERRRESLLIPWGKPSPPKQWGWKLHLNAVQMNNPSVSLGPRMPS